MAFLANMDYDPYLSITFMGNSAYNYLSPAQQQLPHVPQPQQQPPPRQQQRQHVAQPTASPKINAKCICSFCGLHFKQSSTRANHERTKHTKVREFKCRYDDCSKAYMTASQRSAHEKLVHKKERNYVCDECGKSFSSSSNRKTHMRVHSGERPFKCAYCPMAYHGKAALTLHERVKHTSYNGPAVGASPVEKKSLVSCDSCKFTCPNRASMRRHCAKKGHRSRQTEEKRYSALITTPKQNNRLKHLFPDAHKFVGTTKKRTPSPEPEVSDNDDDDGADWAEDVGVSSKPKRRPRTKNASTIGRVSTIFGTSSSTPNTSAATVGHTRTTATNNSCICAFCGAHFSQSSERARHEAVVHTKVRDFKCEYDGCAKAYFTSSQRAAHIKLFHRKERNYTCDVCGNKFSSSSNRKTHMRVHTGERPFKCKYCPIAYHGKAALILHERVKHVEYVEPDPEARKHQVSCDDCSFKCATRSSMRRHCQKKEHDSKQLDEKKWSSISKKPKYLNRMKHLFPDSKLDKPE